MRKNFFKIIIPLAFLGLFLIPTFALASDKVFESIDGRGTWKRNQEGSNEGTFTGTVKEPVEKEYTGIWKEIELHDDPASPYNKKIEVTVIINWKGYVDKDGNINGTWKGGGLIYGDPGGNWRGSKTPANQRIYTFAGITGEGEWKRDNGTSDTGTFTGKSSMLDGSYAGKWQKPTIAGTHINGGDWQADVVGGKIINGKITGGRILGDLEGLWVGSVENINITGVTGSGVWQKNADGDSGSFRGTSSAPDGHYRGSWGIAGNGGQTGKWEGNVFSGQIAGAWNDYDDRDTGTLNRQGTWEGKDPFNQGRIRNYVLPPGTTKTTDTTYNFLEKLPGLEGVFDSKPSAENPCPFGKYLQVIINLIIGICAVLAFVMIVMGGIQYMTSELISSKEAGKSSITNALLGLTIALSAWLVLNTLNPNLLNLCLDKIRPANLTIDAEEIIARREGKGKCIPMKTEGNPCTPSNLASYFPGSNGASNEFNLLAVQASAICNLESNGVANMPIGRSPNSFLDKCSDNKPFSFGLFQINGLAHRESIPACKGAFSIPSGDKQGDAGNCISKDIKSGYCAQWSCKTVEPAYTACQNYLTNPQNNIEYAFKLYNTNKSWRPWTTYNSCKTQF